MLYRAMHQELLLPSAVLPRGIEYASNHQTWLNYYFHIYADKGLVSATSDMAVRGGELTQRDTVAIDGYAYRVANSEIEELFGQRVRYYYYEEDGSRYIVSAVPLRSDSLTIAGEELLGYDKHTYTYYENGREKRARLTEMADFFYNGKSMGDSEAYLPENGSVKLVDSDGNGIYDVVLVTDYTITVIASYSANDETIIDRDKAERNIYLQNNGKRVDYQIINQQGKEIKPESLMTDGVLNAAVSKDGEKVYAILSTKKVTGVVTALSDDEIVLDETSYPLSEKMRDKDLLFPGKTVELLLDFRGKVVAVNTKDVGGLFAYIIDREAQNEGVSKGVAVKYYNSLTASIEVASCRKRVKIDGEYFSKQENLLAGIRTEAPAMISISDGEIAELDYAYEHTPGQHEQKDSLHLVGGEKNTLVYFYNMMLGNKIAVTADTVMVDVPSGGVTAEKEKLFDVSKPSLLETMRYYKIVGYAVGDSLSANYVLRYIENKETRLGVPTMIEALTYSVDDEKETIAVLYGYNRFGEVRCELSSDATVTYSDLLQTLQKGDILNIASDADDKVQQLSVCYQRESGALTEEWYDGAAHYDREFFMARLNHYDGACICYLREDGTSSAERITKYADASVYVYSLSSRRIYRSSVKELKSVERDGYNAADVMLIHQVQMLPRAIFIYRP